MRKTLNFLPILLIALLWITAGIAQAQTPTAAPDGATATSAPEIDATAPASDVVTVDPDGTVTVSVDSTPEPQESSLRLTLLEFALWTAAVLLGGMATAGGLAAFIMRDPARIKMLEQLGNSVPQEHADRVVGMMDLLTPILVLVKEMFDRQPYADKNVGAQIADAFSAERSRLREDKIGQFLNKLENGDAVPPPPSIVPAPNGPANG